MDPEHPKPAVHVHDQHHLSVAAAMSPSKYDLQTLLAELNACFQHEQIRKFTFTWANTLSEKDLQQVLSALPCTLQQLSLSGCVNLGNQGLELISSRFKELKRLNLFYSSVAGQWGNIFWDLGFQTEVRNSMKNYRNFQKYSIAAAKNPQLLHNSLAGLPQKLVGLCLRNTLIGNNTNNLSGILERCQHLLVLDIGQTQVTDETFQKVPKQVAVSFGRRVTSLKIDCNRVSNVGLETMFPGLRQGAGEASYDKLKQLDLGLTKVTKIYEILLQKCPSLESLSLACLEIADTQITLAHEQTSTDLPLRSLNLEYASLQPETLSLLLSRAPHLEELNLGNIEPPGQASNRLLKHVEFSSCSGLKRVSANYNAYFLGSGSVSSLVKTAGSLEILKLSGTRVNAEGVLSLCHLAKDLRWLEISYLQELEVELRVAPVLSEIQRKIDSLAISSDGKPEQPFQQQLTTYRLFLKILASLPRLEYLEAYNFLSKGQITQLHSELQPGHDSRTVTAVLDAQGPITLTYPMPTA